MNSFCISMIQINKLFILILLLLLSLLCLYVPHGLTEIHEHYDYESFLRPFINNNKSSANPRKLLKRLVSFLLKIFRLPQMLLSISVLANIRLVLFNMRFSKAAILRLFSILCFYFHGSKYKKGIKHADLLPLMAI